MIVILAYEKETKNTIRFKEIRADEDRVPVLGSLYIHKSHCPKDVKTIKVTIDVES